MASSQPGPTDSLQPPSEYSSTCPLLEATHSRATPHPQPKPTLLRASKHFTSHQLNGHSFTEYVVIASSLLTIFTSPNTTISPRKNHIYRTKTPDLTRKMPRKNPKHFFSKNRTLNAERRPTSAGTLHRGIVLELEPSRFQRLHIIHLAILQVRRRGRVHKHL